MLASLKPGADFSRGRAHPTTRAPVSARRTEAQLAQSRASKTELKKRTLTNLYNASPTWLENAQERLDEAVFAAFGWSLDLTDEDSPYTYSGG